ncbi:MAG: hypothetical protein Q4P24_18035, partial [Rhodobacterales bacterium]|nr:hypothetical protein [Rhodobacterales bacterium]
MNFGFICHYPTGGYDHQERGRTASRYRCEARAVLLDQTNQSGSDLVGVGLLYVRKKYCISMPRRRLHEAGKAAIPVRHNAYLNAYSLQYDSEIRNAITADIL